VGYVSCLEGNYPFASCKAFAWSVLISWVYSRRFLPDTLDQSPMSYHQVEYHWKSFEQSDTEALVTPLNPPTTTSPSTKNIQQIQTAHRMAPEWMIKSVVFPCDTFSISSPFGQAQVETRRPLYNHLVNCLRYVCFFLRCIWYLCILSGVLLSTSNICTPSTRAPKGPRQIEII